SSRRRHTRCYRDWSSDVCSSDLDKTIALGACCQPAEITGFPPVFNNSGSFHPAHAQTQVGELFTDASENALPLGLAVNPAHAERSEERRVGKDGSPRRMTVDSTK